MPWPCGFDPAPYAELSSRVSTPNSVREGITTAAQFEQWLHAGAFDLAQPDATIIGGIGEARRAAAAGSGSLTSMAARARTLGAGLLLLSALAICGASAGDRTHDPTYDQASDLLAARVEARPGNRALREAVNAQLEKPSTEIAQRVARALADRDVVPLRVPGLLYRSHPQSGADLSAVSDWLGTAVAMVPTDEVGTTHENAAMLARALRARAGGGSRFALISASKGSADVAAALVAYPDLRPEIAVWIDLVGVLEGTPLMDAGSPARARSAAWLPAATADSMSTRGAETLTADAVAGISVVHVAAFPHARDVSSDAAESFALLRREGPTDGYVMLDGYLRVPGPVLVIRGADHYLRAEDLPRQLAAALLVALRASGTGGR